MNDLLFGGMVFLFALMIFNPNESCELLHQANNWVEEQIG